MTSFAVVLVIFHFSNFAFANPFGSQYVCVPNGIEPSKTPLEFSIRDTGNCQKEETLMLVQPQADGSVLLLPAPPPLTKEEKQDLEKYKKYMGINRTTDQ